MSQSIDLVIPALTEHQAAISDWFFDRYLSNRADGFQQGGGVRLIMPVGRQFGKTLLTSYIATKRAVQYGSRVLILSTSQEQADIAWDYLTGKRQWSWFIPLIDAGIVYENKSRRILELSWNKGRIRVKTGSTPDSLRGETADLIIFDESAFLHPATWSQVAAPMFATNNGDAIFISSPKRRNWFYQLHEKAQLAYRADPVHSRQRSYHLPTTANPYVTEAAMQNLIEDMSPDEIRQEIYAEFLPNGGTVFSKIQQAAILDYNSVYSLRGNYVMGVDWGYEHDKTVAIVLRADANPVQMVDFMRLSGIEYTEQERRISQLYGKWRCSNILAEKNAMGLPIIQHLQAQGLPVTGFFTDYHSKKRVVEQLALYFNQESIKIINEPALVSELESFERQQTSTNLIKYAAPAGLHDDCVIALCLALEAAQSATFIMMQQEVAW